MKIKLGKTEHSLHFDMGFINLLLKEYDIDLIGMRDGELKGKEFVNLCYGAVYCGITRWCKKNNVTPPYTKEQIESFVDEMQPTDVIKVTEALFASMNVPAEISTSDSPKEGESIERFQSAEA